MSMDRRQTLLLAATIGVAIGALLASRSRRRQHHSAQIAQHRSDVTEWENEGGNLAPVATLPVPPQP
ncbi:MAG: hypothetical protein ABI607_04870 [Betaproteobacteria bacterium]